MTFLRIITIIVCFLSNVYAYAEKPVVVLFPVQVGAADAEMESDFGSALEEGLQTRFKVYYGPAVESELEKEYQKVDCDAQLCQQNVAIAFNSELVIDASAKRVGDGYSLKMVIHNIATGENVESKTYPCRACDPFAVIDAFKEIGRGKVSSHNNPSITMLGDSASAGGSASQFSNMPAIFIFDSKPSGAEVSINGEVVGKTPYQGLDHKLGESLSVSLKKNDYQSVSFNAQLDSELTRLTDPIVMALGEGQLTVSFEPYQAAMSLWVGESDRGELPMRLTLPAGRHNIKVIQQGHVVAEKNITVLMGSNEPLVLSAYEEKQPSSSDTVTIEGRPLSFVDIPAGNFLMGSERGSNNEEPIHQVTIKEFKMSATEVTFAQWDACVRARACSHKLPEMGFPPHDNNWGRGTRPVMNVSYNDITQQFIPWLNKLTGRQFRLPSEAEWEYAARAGSTTRFNWGDDGDNNKANCRGCGGRWGGKQTAPVASFKANAFGLYDMHGNVEEWVADCWHNGYQVGVFTKKDAPVDGSAWLEDDCDRHPLRGGAWDYKPQDIRSASRESSSSDYRNNFKGFRLAHD